MERRKGHFGSDAAAEALVEARRAASALFDGQPITIGGFQLKACEIVPLDEHPTLDGWRAAFEFSEACEHGSPYWVADLLAYSESRSDWRAKMDQAKSGTGYAHRTLINLASIGRRVKGRARQLAPSISHAAVVASLEQDEQEELLEKAKVEEWTVGELSRAKTDHSRRTVVTGQAPEMHTIEVTVRMTREAASPYLAEQAAWQAVRSAIAGIPHAHVIAAHARPYIQAVRPAKKQRSA